MALDYASGSLIQQGLLDAFNEGGQYYVAHTSAAPMLTVRERGGQLQVLPVAASTPGTSASAATIAWIAFAVTDTSAPAISNNHGYQAVRCPARATTATVATTMMPSTISGHAHACPAPIPERAARSASDVNESQNAPAAMNTVPATAVIAAQRRPSDSCLTALPSPRLRTVGACGRTIDSCSGFCRLTWPRVRAGWLGRRSARSW